MHELPLGMNEGERSVDRQIEGYFFHSHEHEGGHLAGTAGHGQDEAGHDARQRSGQHDATDRLPLARPAGVGTLAHRIRHRRQRLLRGHDHHRQRQQCQGQRSPEQTSGAKRRLVIGNEAGPEKHAVDPRPQEIAEETQAEGAVDDARHTGQIVDGDAHCRCHRSPRGIFPQIECRQHAEGGDENRHDERHGNRAPDRRKHPSGTVGLPRVIGQKLSPPRTIELRLARERKPIGLPGAHDRIERQNRLFSARRLKLHSPSSVLGTQAGGFLVEDLLLQFNGGDDLALPLQALGALPALQSAGKSRLHDVQPGRAQASLQHPPIMFVDPPSGAIPLPGGRMEPLKCLPDRFGTRCHNLLPVHQPQRKAMEPASLQPVDCRGPLRERGGGDGRVFDPLVVVSGEFKVGGAHQPAGGLRLCFPAWWLSHLPAGYFSQHFPAIVQLHQFQGNRPECSRPADRDETEQSCDHRDRQRQRTCREPNPGLAVGVEIRMGRPQASGTLPLRVHATTSESVPG